MKNGISYIKILYNTVVPLSGHENVWHGFMDMVFLSKEVTEGHLQDDDVNALALVAKPVQPGLWTLKQ